MHGGENEDDGEDDEYYGTEEDDEEDGQDDGHGQEQYSPHGMNTAGAEAGLTDGAHASRSRQQHPQAVSAGADDRGRTHGRDSNVRSDSLNEDDIMGEDGLLIEQYDGDGSHLDMDEQEMDLQVRRS